jgi:hypothetical protein
MVLEELRAPIQHLRTLPIELAELYDLHPLEELLRPPAAGGFALCEHVWHLAELESEAWVARVERVLAEQSPQLPDFDGAQRAREGGYRARDPGEGLIAFTRARRGLIERLRKLNAQQLARVGELEGVGPLELRALVARVLAHDDEHRAQARALSRELLASRPGS